MPHISSPALYSHLCKQKRKLSRGKIAGFGENDASTEECSRCQIDIHHISHNKYWCGQLSRHLNVTSVKKKWKSVAVWSKINPWDWNDVCQRFLVRLSDERSTLMYTAVHVCPSQHCIALSKASWVKTCLKACAFGRGQISCQNEEHSQSALPPPHHH